MAQGSPERFETGGRFLGWVGVVAAAGLVVVYLGGLRGTEPFPVQLFFGAIFAGVLFWAVMLRPRVTATPETLELRNPFETVHVPLVAIESHALQQVLAVRAGGKKYVATGVGRSSRAAATGRGGRPGKGGPQGGGSGQVIDAADFVELRITGLVADACERAGVVKGSAAQRALGHVVRRETAWPVVGLLVVTLVPFVASFWF